MPDTFLLDPDDTLDYKGDWSAWLPTGDSIASSVWTVPDDLTATDETSDDTTTTVWLTGGSEGSSYLVTNQITTTQGRVRSHTVTVISRGQ